MNKILIMVCACAGLIVAAVIGPANAASKCVPLTSSTTCTAGRETGKLDWGANCTTGDTAFSIMGVAGCSSQNGNRGDISDSITTSSTSDNNKYCWCKMTAPAESVWVFGDESPSAGICAFNCAYDCAHLVQGYANFWYAMFSNIRD